MLHNFLAIWNLNYHKVSSVKIFWFKTLCYTQQLWYINLATNFVQNITKTFYFNKKNCILFLEKAKKVKISISKSILKAIYINYNFWIKVIDTLKIFKASTLYCVKCWILWWLYDKKWQLASTILSSSFHMYFNF